MLAVQASADDLVTRFGVLSTDARQMLLFNGKPVLPAIEGNNSLTFMAVFRSIDPDFRRDSDVVLIQNNGGTACPAMYHVATIMSSGIEVTPEFGTCSDLIDFAKNRKELTFALPRMDRLGAMTYYNYDPKTQTVK